MGSIRSIKSAMEKLPGRINGKIKKQVVAMAREYEKIFPLRCVIVANPFRFPSAGDLMSFSLIMVPAAERAYECGFEKVAKDCFSLHQEKSFLEHNRSGWNCCCVTGSLDNRPWFSMFEEKKERFPLANNAVGADLISPVIYGEEIMGEMRRQAEEFFGEGIIGFWKEEAIKQIEQKQLKLKEENRKALMYHKERRRLLNRHELKELKVFLRELLQVSNEYEVMVFLDGSGRPIGKAFEFLTGDVSKIFYMDPRQLRGISDDELCNYETVFYREFPQVARVLVRNPGKVLFVDDQTGYGNTARSLGKFISYLSGIPDLPLQLMVMSQYAGNNVPSWLRKREIQGIQLVSTHMTLKSEEFPTPESKRFYARLKKHVLSWRT